MRIIRSLFVFFLLISFTSSLSATSGSAASGIVEWPPSTPMPAHICSSTECYTVIKTLGEGVFGKVYAVEAADGRPFAIKSYKANEYADTLLGDADREFQRGQLLQHANIVKAFDLFSDVSTSDEMTKNLVLELVVGQTLAETKRRSMAMDESLKAISQLVDALRYAFSFELMHLDLHQGNVMLDSDGNLMVIDLASFYSFQEIFGLVADESQPYSGSQPRPTASKHPSQPQTAAMRMAAVEAPAADMLGPVRVEKLRKFFQQNPSLFAELKRAMAEKPPSDTPKVIRLNMGSSQTAACDNASPPANPTQPAISVMQGFYFEKITEICLSLISKSRLTRQEKLHLFAEIKNIFWNYQEDLAEGKAASLEAYLQQLGQMLPAYK